MIQMKRLFIALVILSVAQLCLSTAEAQELELTRETLLDKIKGGWAAQTIGVTYGGWTEFQYLGTFIQDYEPLPWDGDELLWWYENRPGLYDDVYMDLTFVEVLEREGLDAPATAFADAYAHAEYPLWHANQQGRYNILHGLEPPASGHWRNNPEADDIDFQIEADFAGLMSPGLPQAAADISDRVGHIMNSGDGYYGGLYVATMYALAFTSDDVEYVVEEALKAIPEQSTFYKTIRDVIHWYRTYPNDWHRNWFEIQRKWSEDVGCPEGVFRAFNIDAKLNAAYVVLGLLYGEGDFGRTLEIATRAGQDSDCNPATAGGILATMMGYDAIPAKWKAGLSDVEGRDFRFTTISLLDVYEMSLRHALETIRRSGGTVDGERVVIPIQPVETAPLEQNFVGHVPVGEVLLNRRVTDETTFQFDGIGFAVTGRVETEGEEDLDVTAEVYIDDILTETVHLPGSFRERRFIPFFQYDLPSGRHEVRIRLKERAPQAVLRLDHAIIYGSSAH